MKFIYNLFVVLLLSWIMSAGFFPQAAQAGKTSVPAVAARPRQQQTPQVAGEKKKSTKTIQSQTPTTFEPTEKIGADTVIGFPADI
jgi:hypothetical protein